MAGTRAGAKKAVQTKGPAGRSAAATRAAANRKPRPSSGMSQAQRVARNNAEGRKAVKEPAVGQAPPGAMDVAILKLAFIGLNQRGLTMHPSRVAGLNPSAVREAKRQADADDRSALTPPKPLPKRKSKAKGKAQAET